MRIKLYGPPNDTWFWNEYGNGCWMAGDGHPYELGGIGATTFEDSYVMMDWNDVDWDWVVESEGGGFTDACKFGFPGIRPVVCLKSNVTLEEVGENQYNLVIRNGNSQPSEEENYPTAPVITGGNTTFNATSLTISVSEEAVDLDYGIDYYEYYLSDNFVLPTESTEGIRLTTSEKSQTFSENLDGYCIYFRAVNKAGEKGKWSNVQFLFIDTAAPVVTANNTRVTAGKGIRKYMEDLFTADSNGNGSIANKYTINGTEYTSTYNLGIGTYTVVCTTTKENGLTANASLELVVQLLPDEETYLEGQTFYSSYDEDGDGFVTEDWIWFTVPEGVNVIKMEWEKDYRPELEKIFSMRCTTTGKWWLRDITTEKICYVGVTPGKRYEFEGTAYLDTSEYNTCSIRFTYSKSINEVTNLDFTDY